MAENLLQNVCRLCLTDHFQLCNIFSDRSLGGSMIYQALNFVYNLEIYPDDGLPSHICKPCFWKMKEFEVYKKNVHCARLELWEFKRKRKEPCAKSSRNEENGGSQNTHETEQYDSNSNLSEENTIASDGNNVLSKCSAIGEDETVETHGNGEDIWPQDMHSNISDKNVRADKNNVLLKMSAIGEGETVETRGNGEDIWPQDMHSNISDKNVRADKNNVLLKMSAIGEGETVETRGNGEDIWPQDMHSNISDKNVRADKNNVLLKMEHVSAYTACLHEEVILSDEEDCKPDYKSPVKSPITNADSSSDGRNSIQEVREGIMISDCRSILHMPADDENINLLTILSPGSNIIGVDTGTSCDICLKKLSSRGKLRRHMAIHNDERPYSCVVCGMKFGREDSRRRHQLRHREAKAQLKTLQSWLKK